ncbi:upstream stimulatory factor 2 isoform X2 [Patella vulgata]|uniref:upstream stimulatory factor 2 isoform X2 n=1 Tax=Patella vulgata TaxID=6465 RepID=UPI002180359A|nr:upstream stimulatory factor 2 isoform X2 [Patella vulgata]
MDMLDQALETSQDKGNDSPVSEDHIQLQTHVQEGETTEEQAAAIASVANSQGLTLDPSTVQYQFRADGQGGPVTYRVVQVSQDGSEATAQVVTTTGFPQAQVAQAVIQSPFSNGGSPTPDGQEQRFAYYQGAGDATTVTTQASADVTAATLGQVQSAGGQFYVMMSPQDVLQNQRSIAPRTSYTPKMDGRSPRDDRRRATHNEVERRRRDKINNWIVQLSKVVPDCASEQAKTGANVNLSLQSKGGILSKACDYITELRTSNARMAETLKETERISVDNELLRQQCEELKQENAILRSHLQQHGLVLPDSMPSSS